MMLKALVLSGDVSESPFYDQLTGKEKPSFVVDLTVLDADTDEKYDVQITEGFAPLEKLKQARRDGAPADAQRQLADQVRNALPPKLTPLTLEVVRFKGKQVAFIKLVCRLVQAGAPAGTR
jgi:hypothetical protein